MIRLQCPALLVILSLSTASVAEAGTIADRTALQLLLGGPGVLEDFETFSVVGGAVNTDCAILNSASICNGQGPGLVVPGINIVASQQIQWDDAGYFGAPSKEILSNSGDGTIRVNFLSLVTAFGIDLRAFTGFPDTAVLTVYATDNVTVIGSVPGIALGSGLTFAGWESLSGIGGFSVSQTQSWSPILDNLEFGVAAVPEPATLLLLGTGLGAAAARRRLKKRA